VRPPRTPDALASSARGLRGFYFLIEPMISRRRCYTGSLTMHGSQCLVFSLIEHPD